MQEKINVKNKSNIKVDNTKTNKGELIKEKKQLKCCFFKVLKYILI